MISAHSCPLGRLGSKDTGGMNIYVREMARELGRRGHRVDVYTRCHTDMGAAIVPLGENARVVHVPAGEQAEADKQDLYAHLPEFTANMQARIAAEDATYDLVHSHYWLSGLVGLSLGLSAPHVVMFHTLAELKRRAEPGEPGPEGRLAGERAAVQGADLILAASTHERWALSHYYGANPEKIAVVPCGVDTESFRPRDRSLVRKELGLNGDRLVLFVGRLEPLKGLDVLLGALAQLEERSHVRALIIGGDASSESEVARLKELARALGVEDQVVFLGSVEHERLPLFYSAADVCIMPSSYESFGIAALESLSCGTPVIATRVGGLATLVRDGETGYLVSPRCPEPFAERLEMLLDNETLRGDLSAAARAHARAYDWSLICQQVVARYRDLLEGTPK